MAVLSKTLCTATNKGYLTSFKKTTNPNLLPIGKRFGPRCFGADVHKGFNKHTGTVQSYLLKRTFFNSPLLRYNVLAKEDFLLSNVYTVFEVVDEKELIPQYLMLWFSRPEFDRFARFKSHGSVRNKTQS